MARFTSVTGYAWLRYHLSTSRSFAKYAAKKVAKQYGLSDVPLFIELPNGRRYQVLGDSGQIKELE